MVEQHRSGQPGFESRNNTLYNTVFERKKAEQFPAPPWDCIGPKPGSSCILGGAIARLFQDQLCLVLLQRATRSGVVFNTFLRGEFREQIQDFVALL